MLLALLLFPLGMVLCQECDSEGAFPDPDQCDKYWECRGGNLASHLCPDGLVYDLTTSVASFQVHGDYPQNTNVHMSRWGVGRLQVMAADAVIPLPSTAQADPSCSRLNRETIARARMDTSQLPAPATSIGSAVGTSRQQSTSAR